LRRYIDYITYVLLFVLLGLLCFTLFGGIVALNTLYTVSVYYNKILITASVILFLSACYTTYETIMLDSEKKRSKEDEKNYSNYLSYNVSSDIG
jgi:uncharacterized membrane protein